VFIVLPAGDRGEDILAAIRREMPGLQVVDWPFELDGPKVRRRTTGTPHERLLTFMENRALGRTSMQVIARELSLTGRMEITLVPAEQTTLPWTGILR
jgi:hypothetical protein